MYVRQCSHVCVYVHDSSMYFRFPRKTTDAQPQNHSTKWSRRYAIVSSTRFVDMTCAMSYSFLLHIFFSFFFVRSMHAEPRNTRHRLIEKSFGRVHGISAINEGREITLLNSLAFKLRFLRRSIDFQSSSRELIESIKLIIDLPRNYL